MRFKTVLLILSLNITLLNAHEGMWVPFLLQQQIFPEMQIAGCKLTPEQIYSAQQNCLTNAIVRVGGGCTGGLLSKNGLVITNYHCVDYFITAASTKENNYLQNGFWAKKMSDEIQTTGLTCDILVSFEDITEQVNALLNASSKLASDYSQKLEIVDSLQKLEDKKTEFKISIESFYEGNQFFKFTYLHYTDVRLVGFPSVSVAQFGDVQDNWQWPRTSADFALLRIYTDSLQKSSKFNLANIPLQNKSRLIINPNGVKQDDFTMVLGYPAHTNNYATSEQLRLIRDSLNPRQIKAREIRLEPIKQIMLNDKDQYLKYYSLYSDLSNYYVKWQGEQYGLKNTNAIEERAKEEQSFLRWLSSVDSLREYSSIIDNYNAAYSLYVKSYIAVFLYLDAFMRMDYSKHAVALFAINNEVDTAKLRALIPKKKKNSESYFSKKMTVSEVMVIPELLEYINTNLPAEFISPSFRNKSKEQRFALYNSMIINSILIDEQKNNKFFTIIQSPKYSNNKKKIQKELMKDDGFRLMSEIYTTIAENVYPFYYSADYMFSEMNYKYQQLLRLYYKDSAMFPNANSTMRVSFGNVKPYFISSTETYNSQSSQYDLYAKIQTGNIAYTADSSYISVLKSKDFGTFSKDTLYMNFIATNQTSGGSSGSPVLDAYGNIVGLNFDRNWQGTMGDFYFDESVCRNISVDIRFILFCIEILGNASNIIRELEFKP